VSTQDDPETDDAGPIARRPPVMERILLGAEHAFAKLGLRDARVDDILVAADVSRRTFYKRYAGKDEVAEALLVRSVETLIRAVMERAARTASPREQIEAAVDVYLDLFREHGRLARDLFVESQRPGSPLAPTRAKAVERVVSFIVDDVARRSGTKLDPLRVTHLLLGLEGLVLSEMLRGDFSAKQAERIKAAVLPLFEDTLLAKRG